MNGTTEFGCSTYTCMDLPLAEALEKIREKTSVIEILSDGPHDLFHHLDACSSVDARFSVHMPNDINLASTNERIRTLGLQVIDELLGICDLLNAEILVVHPGYCAWTQTREESHAAFLRSLGNFARIQEEHDVRIAIENLGSWDCCHFRTPDAIASIHEKGLGFVLDVGHANLNGNLPEFLGNASPAHVHLHDNGGISDDHAACGTGIIDFAKLLPQLPDDVSCILEVKTLDAYSESVRYLSGLEYGNPAPGTNGAGMVQDRQGEI